MTAHEPRTNPPGFSRIGYDTGVEYLARRVPKWIVVKRAPHRKRAAHLEHLHQVTCLEVREAYPEQENAFRSMYSNCRTDAERYALIEYTRNSLVSARLWWVWYYQREALLKELGQQGDGRED